MLSCFRRMNKGPDTSIRPKPVEPTVKKRCSTAKPIIVPKGRGGEGCHITMSAGAILARQRMVRMEAGPLAAETFEPPVVQTFDTAEQLRQALLEFRKTYYLTWLIERHGFRIPDAIPQDQLSPAAVAA